MEKVSWDDIQKFLTRLNAQEAGNIPAGWAYVLPTEAQWEYACRAGTTTAYSWGDSITTSNANYSDSGYSQTRDVGLYSANPWGFFDMHGNVWEWTADWYAAYSSGAQTDPEGPATGSYRVNRGGSWYDTGTYLRSAYRLSFTPSHRASGIGFRVGFQKVPGDTPLTDSNFHDAIALWFDAEENATAIYGHISDWNTSAVTNMSYAFQDRTGFNEDISEWDTSFVINMMRMFSGATSFNQPIGDWNVSSVTNIRGIFNSATSFNQALGNWDVSSVTDMREVFMSNSAFNQPIGTWDVSSATTMYQMFHQATSFNQPITDWNVSGVTNMRVMFKTASEFNQDISDWNISAVTSMGSMFDDATSLSDANKGRIQESFAANSYWEHDWREFVSLDNTNFQTAVNLWFDNQADANATYGHISDWNTSAVTDMSNAFLDRTEFNEDIGNWDVSNVVTMDQMFRNASLFNKDIGRWDMSSLASMVGMFRGATAFNQPIGNWDVSSVTNMTAMFMDSGFSGDISSWETSSVTNMSYMFEWTNFNSDISDWNVSSVQHFVSMFNGASFDLDISGWDVSAALSFDMMFNLVTDLSDNNKGLIHQSFSTNENWPYDWSAFINYAPTDLNSTAPLTIAENQPIGTIVGEFNATDPEGGAIFYSLVDGNGSSDNHLFTLNENGTLKTATVFDYENNASSYTITVQAKDELNATTEGNFTVTLLDVYEPSRENHSVDLNYTVSMEMIWVEPGTFTMGSPVDEPGRQNDENQTEVTLTRGFYLGKYEVTQAQYEAVMTGNQYGLSPTPSDWPNNPNRPVDKVSYNDLQKFLMILNQSEQSNLPEGWAYVLPTEAEWEYACRAGTTTTYSWGDGINSSLANYTSSGHGETVDVGQYQPNPWGFYDMHGNLWEATSDRYYTYAEEPVVDPVGTGDGVVSARGGSWNRPGSLLRAADRLTSYDSGRFYAIGFRLALRDINKAPVDLNSTAPLTIAENQPAGTIVGEFNATDPEGGAITFILPAGENNNSLFALDTNGTLKTATTFDYESNSSTIPSRCRQRMN